MSLCPHGVRIEHKRCDRCEEIAEAENRARDRQSELMSRRSDLSEFPEPRQAGKHLFEESPGDQELRVGWKDNPIELRIEGTPHALTLVQHLISQALSMTTEGNTVTAIHQKTGAKITVKRTDL